MSIKIVGPHDPNGSRTRDCVFLESRVLPLTDHDFICLITINPTANKTIYMNKTKEFLYFFLSLTEGHDTYCTKQPTIQD